MRRAALLLAIAACGGKGARGGMIGNESGEAGPVRAVTDASWVDCPPGLAARYEQQLAAENIDGDEIRVGRCLPGRFGDATLAAFVEMGPPEDSQAETGTMVYLALLAADGAQRAFGHAGGYDWIIGPAEARFLADFDGDGIDEIVMHQTGPGWAQVGVLHRAGAEVEVMLHVPGSGEEPDPADPADRCVLAVSIDQPATLVVTATDDPEYPPGESDSGSCDGDYRYRWQDGAFAMEAPIEPEAEEE